MPPRRRTDPAAGLAAVDAWLEHGTALARADLLTAVRFSLEEFAALHPGNSVEIRVPPAGATQAIAGPRHTRGTPPNVVEMRPHTWLALVTGRATWDDVIGRPLDDGGVSASGIRADLADYVPFLAPRDGTVRA